MKAAIAVNVMTENQSIALIPPRLKVGKPNAANITKGGNSGSKSALPAKLENTQVTSTPNKAIAGS